MQYYFNKTLPVTFDQAEQKVTEALKAEGFGVLTEINVKDVFKKKLDKDFRQYKILGACNPNFAFEAISLENKVGILLPCNVVLQDTDKGVEVAIVNPEVAMKDIESADLAKLAGEVKTRLNRVLEAL